MSLTDFLLARIDEDEAVARKALPSGGDDTWTSWVCDEFMHVATGEDRVLAECEAKRAVAQYALGLSEEGREDGAAILRHLATPYADHPDYREEWKP